MYVHTYVCTYVRTYVRMYVCMYVCNNFSYKLHIGTENDNEIQVIGAVHISGGGGSTLGSSTTQYNLHI